MCEKELAEKLNEVSLHFHPVKTRIYPLSNGIKILGFTFRLTDTGKVIRIIDPKNVKHERKKLVKMAHLVAKGEMSKAKFYQCYNAWKAHAELGNSYLLLQEMDAYVKQILREAEHENYSTNR